MLLFENFSGANLNLPLLSPLYNENKRMQACD